MKKIMFWFLCLLLVTQTDSQTPVTNEKLSLQKCIETGIINNQAVLQSELQTQTAELNWKQAKANRLPNLNGSVGHGVNQGRSIDPFTNSFINQQVNYAAYGLSSGVTLFSGFVIQNNIKQNQLIFQAAKMESQQAKDNLTINIILAYLLVLNNEDVLTISYKQAELSKKQVERLDILNKEGAIAPSLLSDLQGQYANDQLTIINIKNALESSKLSLAQLMNIPYDKNLQLERLNIESLQLVYENTPEKIYESALQKFALVKATDLRTQSAEKAVKVAKGQLFPSLSFNGNVNTSYSDAARQDIFLNTTDLPTSDFVTINNTQFPVIRKVNNYSSNKIIYGKQINNNLFTSFSLNLRIPIFNSFQVRNKIKLEQINLSTNELAAKTTKTQLQQAIDLAYINMISASERYKTLEDQATAFKESFRAAEIRFESGLGTSIDYLTAKNNLDRTTTNFINAKYDFMLRTKVLDYYDGKNLW